MNFNLIPEWKQVVAKAHSMWAFYLSIPALWMSDIIYLVLEIDTNPRIWILLSQALIVYGIIGRIKDQKITVPE